MRPCPNCRGFGTTIPSPCIECSGDGRVRSRRTVTVKIPGGVDTGNGAPGRALEVALRPDGDVEVDASELVAASIPAEEVPTLVDELPLVALAAGVARGETVIKGAGELRLKETDRLENVKELLKPLGIRIAVEDDTLRIRGVPARPKGGGTAHSDGDHRMAILAAIAGLVSREGVRVEGAEAAAISFPGFFELLNSVAKR